MKRSWIQSALAALVAVTCAGVPVRADGPFPVEPYPWPFRSVAGVGDLHALRYNPASLGQREEVEFGWFHKFSGDPTGFNSVTLRTRALGLSVSWIHDPVFGKRREYLIGAGRKLSKTVLLGATFRWLKADAPSLQNRTTWTFAATYVPSTLWAAGARWENAFHSKVNGSGTDGIIVAGIHARPLGPRVAVSLDWIYPQSASPDHTDLRLAAVVKAMQGVHLHAFVDTDERFGFELQILVERSSGGTEIRFTDLQNYVDGTLYLTVLNEEYPDARRRSPR